MKTDIQDSYRELDLAPGAELKLVRESYIQLVKVWHPDRFAGDPKLQEAANDKLKRINLAYESISDYLQSGLKAREPSTPTPSPSRKSPEAPTASESRRTASVDELPPWADWAIKLFTAAAKKRNVEISRTFQVLINQRQEPVGGLAVLRKGTGPAKVVLNYKDLASWGFAFFQIFLDDLLNSPSERDRRAARSMLETADREPAFHQWVEKIVDKAQKAGTVDGQLTAADFLNDPYPLFTSPKITGRATGAQEEYIAYRTGEYFAKHVGQGEGVSGFKNEWQDLKAATNLRFGDATSEDASRILNSRFFKDPDFYYTHCKSGTIRQ